MTENNKKKNLALPIAFGVVVLFVLMAVWLVGTNKPASDQKDGTSKTTQTTVASGSTETLDAGKIGPNETKLTDTNFKENVENSKGVYLVDFYLSTCTFCQRVAQTVSDVADDFAGKAKVGKLEASQNPTVSELFKIESVPTFIVFKDGKEAERMVGAKTKDELTSIIEKYLK